MKGINKPISKLWDLINPTLNSTRFGLQKGPHFIKALASNFRYPKAQFIHTQKGHSSPSSTRIDQKT